MADGLKGKQWAKAKGLRRRLLSSEGFTVRVEPTGDGEWVAYIEGEDPKVYGARCTPSFEPYHALWRLQSDWWMVWRRLQRERGELD